MLFGNDQGLTVWTLSSQLRFILVMYLISIIIIIIEKTKSKITINIATQRLSTKTIV